MQISTSWNWHGASGEKKIKVFSLLCIQLSLEKGMTHHLKKVEFLQSWIPIKKMTVYFRHFAIISPNKMTLIWTKFSHLYPNKIYDKVSWYGPIGAVILINKSRKEIETGLVKTRVPIVWCKFVTYNRSLNEWESAELNDYNSWKGELIFHSSKSTKCQ